MVGMQIHNYMLSTSYISSAKRRQLTVNILYREKCWSGSAFVYIKPIYESGLSDWDV